MKHAFGLDIPETLEEVYDPKKTALLVYDMQAGIFQQADALRSVIPNVVEVVQAARTAHIPIIFTRHLTVPNNIAGMTQLRTAMLWQQVEPQDIRARFLRDSKGFQLLREIQPQADEAVLDKIGMSAFTDTPLNTILRDRGITTCFIAGVVLEMGILPTVSNAVDLGYVPVIITDACGSVDEDARVRALAQIGYMQTSLTTTVEVMQRLLTQG